MNTIRQFIRYGLLGVATNVTAYLFYLLITHYGVNPKITMTVLYVLVFSLSFIGNKKWAFSHKGNTSDSVTRFFIAHAIGYTINLCTLYIFVDIYKHNHQLIQLMTMAFLVLYFFITLKYFVFKTQKY